MKKLSIGTLIATVCLSLDAHATDLVQIYQQALSNDPSYASARAALAASREKVPQARAGLLPGVDVSTDVTKSESVTTNTSLPSRLPDGTIVTGKGYNSRTGSVTVSLTQPLLRWDRWQSYEQSKLAPAIAEALFAQAQQDLMMRVAQAYFDVLSAEDSLGLVRSQKAALSEQLGLATRKLEQGLGTISDMQDAQAASNLVAVQEFAAVTDLNKKRRTLQVIIGTAPGALAHVNPGLPLAVAQTAKIEQWIGSAEQENHAVQAAKLGLESARFDIARNRAGHYPALDLVASSTRGRNRGDFSSTSTYNSVGLQLSVPIFSGFAITSKVREAIALEDKARHDMEAAQQSASLSAQQAFLDMHSGLEQVAALEAAEVSSQKALESNQQGYKIGMRSNTDVLNAQMRLYATRTDLAKARYDTILNRLKLKAAAGSLGEEDLKSVNNLLRD